MKESKEGRSTKHLCMMCAQANATGDFCHVCTVMSDSSITFCFAFSSDARVEMGL